MDIQAFANRYRLRVKRHKDGEAIISGKLGYVYEHDDSLLGLLFLPERPRLWPNARRKLEAADFVIWQDGDEEGSALNRDTGNAIRAAGFCIDNFDRPTLPGFMDKLHPLIRGVATKSEAIGSESPASNPPPPHELPGVGAAR